MLISFYKTIPTYEEGFSLVELLIALLLGSLLIVMMLSLYVSSLSTGSINIKNTRLRSDLQSIISLLEDDIRRAGSGGENYLVGINSDKSIDINNGQDCIVYYYNHDHSLAVESSNQMAFNLINGTIKFKLGVGKVAESVCAETSGWTSVSDPQFITITDFKLTDFIYSSASATQHSVTIDLSGQLTSKSDYNYAISTQVRIKNTY